VGSSAGRRGGRWLALAATALLAVAPLLGCASAERAGPSALPDPGSAVGCALEKALLSGSSEALVDLGLPAGEVARWMTVRRGPDGVEGTEDDAWVDVDSAREVLGEARLARLAAEVGRSDRWRCDAVSLQLLAFNDFHGALEPPSGSGAIVRTAAGPVEAGGVAWLATRVRELREAHPGPTLVVAAGDLIGATPVLSALFHDEPTIEALDLVGLDISSVGNHEFDAGRDELLRKQRGGCHPTEGCADARGFAGARFQYLAAGVVDEATGEELLPPWTVRRFGRVRVGFIGMTLAGTPAVVKAESIVGLRFEDEATTANRHAAELRARGVDAVVVLIHEGGRHEGGFDACVDPAGAIVRIAGRMSADIDVVVSGHTHQAYVCELSGKLVTSAASNGRLVTAIELALDEAGGGLQGRRATNHVVSREGEPDPRLVELLARWRALAGPVVGRVVGAIAADITRRPTAAGETPLGSLVADAQLWAAREAVGASGARPDLALMNPGGVRADLIVESSDFGEPPGAITYAEAFAVQPFRNDLVVVSLTGAQLLELLEQQFGYVRNTPDRPRVLHVSANVRYTWRADAPAGERVLAETVTVDGAPLARDRVYRVVVNSFLAGGGDRFSALADAPAESTGMLDVDAFVRYLEAHPDLDPPAPGRIHRR